MTWIQRYNLRHYILNSVWVLPVAGMVTGWVLVAGLNWIERRAGWQSSVNPDAARALFGTLAGAMFTFIIFLSSTLLLVLQIASAQLTPRIIGIVFRDRVTRLAFALFTFTFTFTLIVLVRIQDSVPAVTAHLAAYLCLLSIGVFLFLIDHVGAMLRPSGGLRTVARLGHIVIRRVYPRLLSSDPPTASPPAKTPKDELACTIPSPKDGVFLEFGPAGLVAEASRIDCVVELVPRAGDFVAVGSPLFRIYGGHSKPSASALRQWIALGPERTMEQDPAFAFRIIVDIASKALSSAINDPTTAVLAIDQIHHLLQNVGRRCLDEETRCDEKGALRLIYPMPKWEDFVYLAVTEIRQFGGASIQVVRRLHAMLENLIEVLPPERAKPLLEELALLGRSAKRLFPEPEDRVLANISDSQSVGGKPSDGEARGKDQATKHRTDSKARPNPTDM
jgi:uncharacterized membrane protein